MARRGRVHIGTSGWHYRHWLGPFYPPAIKPEEMLGFYCRHFHSVELNNTFYRLPRPGSLEKWRAQVPDGFLFACKGSRFITHMTKLKDPERNAARFFEAIDRLGPALGPILFQLPPGWGANAERLDGFLSALPGGRSYAFEFRNESWFAEPVLERLAKHAAGFCIYDIAGRQAPEAVTADFVYLRLHGPAPTAYCGLYGEAGLRPWAEKIESWCGEARDVYCYFDNDEAGHAARDALMLRDMLGA